jgi:hypothetical protein
MAVDPVTFRHVGASRVALGGSVPKGSLTFSASGMDAFEKAVNALLSEPAIKVRWAPEGFWSVIGSLIATASRPDEVWPSRHVDLTDTAKGRTGGECHAGGWR